MSTKLAPKKRRNTGNRQVAHGRADPSGATLPKISIFGRKCPKPLKKHNYLAYGGKNKIFIEVKGNQVKDFPISGINFKTSSGRSASFVSLVGFGRKPFGPFPLGSFFL